jgi:hypothetical protein
MSLRYKAILGLIFLILLSMPAIAATANGVEFILKTYTKNIFGWEATSVKTTAHGVLNGCSGGFDTRLSYTRHEAHAAWWCFTCYSHVTSYYPYKSTSVIAESTNWKQGSWNVEYRGANIVYLYWYGGCDVRELGYYNLDGTTNKVWDSLKHATEWVLDHFDQILGVVKG